MMYTCLLQVKRLKHCNFLSLRETPGFRQKIGNRKRPRTLGEHLIGYSQAYDHFVIFTNSCFQNSCRCRTALSYSCSGSSSVVPKDEELCIRKLCCTFGAGTDRVPNALFQYLFDPRTLSEFKQRASAAAVANAMGSPQQKSSNLEAWLGSRAAPVVPRWANKIVLICCKLQVAGR
jgi:hypothetical protein